MSVRRVALLTAGGFAPCLSSAVGGLIERYNEIDPSVEIIAYQNGYHGLLTGNYVLVDEEARKHAAVLHRYGGSPIGNSRVKLTNKKNLVERGLVAEDEDPLQKAAEQLRTDGVDVLHTIGGDDTNTTAADLAAYLEEHDYHLTVVGLPKTIEDVYKRQGPSRDPRGRSPDHLPDRPRAGRMAGHLGRRSRYGLGSDRPDHPSGDGRRRAAWSRPMSHRD